MGRVILIQGQASCSQFTSPRGGENKELEMEQSFSCFLCPSFCEGRPSGEYPFLNALWPQLVSQQTHLGCVGPVPRAGDK